MKQLLPKRSHQDHVVFIFINACIRLPGSFHSLRLVGPTHLVSPTEQESPRLECSTDLTTREMCWPLKPENNELEAEQDIADDKPTKSQLKPILSRAPWTSTSSRGPITLTPHEIQLRVLFVVLVLKCLDSLLDF